ncbi:MAG: phosphoribosyl-AMP cyclohydrolase [Gammaproteobacteria bacterium]|jgi:phosphoribosyl-AMP cyclohydrolase|nr:phosphoribosyl-AMP cyclohydrolase [Gammaproteobacteria bacterium]
MSISAKINFNEAGLIPAIAQDYETNEILMVAWMNIEAFELTLEKKQAVYFSRSRNKLWFKGEESGNMQIVKDVYTDCDNDVILLKVQQVGGIACHTGRESCFFQKIDGEKIEVTKPVIKDPKEIYG